MSGTSAAESPSDLGRLAPRVAAGKGILAVLTLTVSVGTPPRSGPFCMAERFVYPYTDVADRFPRDYWWMYLAS